jgi:protein SCO1/2
MTGQMAAIQGKLPAGVQLVSFDVNPEHDTPAVLKSYAADWKADESKWHFLTGTSEQIFGVAAGMNMAAQPAQGDKPILHDRRLLLVDAAGNVRGIDDGAMARLVTDARALAKEPAAGVGTARSADKGEGNGVNGGGAS